MAAPLWTVVVFFSKVSVGQELWARNGVTGEMSADAESNCFSDNRHALLLEIKEKSLINRCYSVEILK